MGDGIGERIGRDGPAPAHPQHVGQAQERGGADSFLGRMTAQARQAKDHIGLGHRGFIRLIHGITTARLRIPTEARVFHHSLEADFAFLGFVEGKPGEKFELSLESELRDDARGDWGRSARRMAQSPGASGRLDFFRLGPKREGRIFRIR